MTARARMVLAGLDAADLARLERLADEGRAPVFGDLRRRGALGRLTSLGRWLPGSVWPTFHTSTPASETGFHHYLQWSPEHMALRRPDPTRVGTPFWRLAAQDGAATLAIDMPFAPAPRIGAEITGWATLDSLEPPRAWPESLLSEVRAVHGRSPRVAEMHALQTPQALLRLRDQQVRIAEQLAEIAERLLARRPVDLLAITFPGLHRGGHWLWDETGLCADPGADARAKLGTALDDIYASTDAALGRILDAGRPDEIIVFSLHGMGPNTSRVELLDEMLHRVLTGARTGRRPVRAADRIRQAVPARVRHHVKESLPAGLQDRLTGYWRTGGRDWQATPAIAQAADLTGYIRFIIAGRESRGWLSRTDAEALARRLSDGLASFVDSETGEPIVSQAARIEDILPPGPGRKFLPDLMIDWADSPAARHRAVVSPGFGTIDWRTPGRHPSGRSGNHRAGGFYLAVGPAIGAGQGPSGDILDLAPTVLARLGAAIPPSMHGRPLLERLLHDHPRT